MDLRNSVIIPREDFLELQEVAYQNQNPPSLGERALNSGQAIVVFAGLSVVGIAATWGYVKVMDKLDERRHKREIEIINKREEFLQARKSAVFEPSASESNDSNRPSMSVGPRTED